MNISDFKSNFSGGVKANLYRMELSGISEKLRFLCKAAQIPGKTIGMIEVPFRGRMLKVSGDRTFEDFTVTVTNDQNFAVRNALERWHDAISGNVSNVSERGLDSSNFSSYVANIEVQQLGRAGEVLKTYRMIGAWPTTIDAIDVSYESTDTVEEFGVTFAYQWWESDTVAQPTTGGFE